MYNYSPVGKYHYKRLTMGVRNSLEISQQKMNDLFQGFKFIRAYMDELLISTKRRLDRSCTEIGTNFN